MSERTDIFSDRIYLKEINPNFDTIIELIRSIYTPIALRSSEKSLERNIILLEFIQEWNGSNQDEQIQLLSNLNDSEQLWTFLSLNPISYDCQTFLDELYQLTSTSLLVKQHLAFHLEDFLFTLSISYDDHLRFACLKIVALLMNDSHPQSKPTIARLNRMCYECLYDFDVYYQTIQLLTMPSVIISLTKDDMDDLFHGENLRKDLDEQILEAMKELDGYVFIKMHRSPKDAYETLRREINDDWMGVWNLEQEENPYLYFMKIRNLNQLKLLFKCSDRLREDYNANSYNGKLILRKWIDYLPNEYRCFVCHGQVNALSTYGSNQDLINNEKQINEFVNSKIFRDIILTIPYSHGIVDCSIDLIHSNVTIIEVNPFTKRSSSAAKFSWIIDRDILYDHYQTHGCVNIKL